MDDVERIRAVYEDFGSRWAHGTSPLYEDWAHEVARDPWIGEWLVGLPRRMQQPNLLFAASRWEGAPLTTSAFAAWLAEHRDAVEQTMATRATQTNEPGRCATLLPVLSGIDGPLALLEVGTAAGLCLFPDRYGYTYAAPSGVHRLGSSPVDLHCRLDEDDALPGRMPGVAWRRGIDLSPIDATDAEAVDWLATLVWPGPDHDARVARLRAAAAVAASDPPDIVQGDLLERLDDVAAEAPADATLVVFHSAVLLYLDAEERRRFAELVTALPRRLGRPIVWISNETAGALPEFDAQLPPGIPTDHRFVQTVDGRAFALAGQHGAVYETRVFR